MKYLLAVIFILTSGVVMAEGPLNLQSIGATLPFRPLSNTAVSDSTCQVETSTHYFKSPAGNSSCLTFSYNVITTNDYAKLSYDPLTCSGTLSNLEIAIDPVNPISVSPFIFIRTKNTKPLFVRYTVLTDKTILDVHGYAAAVYLDSSIDSNTRAISEFASNAIRFTIEGSTLTDIMNSGIIPANLLEVDYEILNCEDVEESGAVGPKGDDGTNGTDGIDGTNGTNGTDGIDGTNGTDGTNGINGIDGINGINGTNGVDGTNGTDGDDGMDGADGDNGMDGDDGMDGADGTDVTTDSPEPLLTLLNHGTIENLRLTTEMTFAATFTAFNLDNCGNRDCRLISKATGVRDHRHDWMLSTVRTREGARLRFRLRINGFTHTLVATRGNIVDNDMTVYQGVVTYDGVIMKIYLDGELVGVNVAPGVITQREGGLTYGGSNDGADSKLWEGSMLEIDVYDVALTEQQIQDKL
jgi:hypothetical protein